MRDYACLTWDKKDVRVRSVSSSNRGKATTVKVELEVSEPYALSSLMRELAEAQRPPAPVAPPAPARRKKAEPLALPAPQLRLEDRR